MPREAADGPPNNEVPVSDSTNPIARLWSRGPNAERIGRVLRRFLSLNRQERELLLISLDIEEGILPLIHPGGRASRREVLCDQRLIAVGDDIAYGRHISNVLGAASASAASATPGAEAQAAQAARATRGVRVERGLSIDEVVGEDKLGMTVWFPQFVFGRMQPGNRPAWCGRVQPLAFLPHVYQLLIVYQPDAMAPPRFYVLSPAIHPHAPHRYGDRALCTFFPPMGSWIRGRAGDDLTELIRFAIVWLLRYECWLAFDGWWPGVEVSHDPAVMVATLDDDDFCPYHAPQKWGACCKARHVEELARMRALDVGILQACQQAS